MLIVLAGALDFMFGIVYLGDRVLDSPLGAEFSNCVNLNFEMNLPAWYSSIQLFALGAFLFALARVFIGRHAPRAWIMMILALAFFGLSLDEFASFHERLGIASDALLPGGHRSNTVFHRTGIWFFLAVPVFVGLLWMTLAMRKLWSNGCATVTFLVGLTVFLGSAAGTEILSNFTTGFALTLQITAEEVGEMLGVTIMLWAAYELMTSHGIAVFARQADLRSINPLSA